jgi:uncharacterized protein YutE (UPF0331/DUF86 family)
MRYRVTAITYRSSQRSRRSERLAEIRVFPVEFATRLRPLAGFRNVLVHGYLQVDLGIVEQVLNAKLYDLEQFAFHVEKFLAQTAD